MPWKSDIVNKLNAIWLTLFVGLSIIGYFGVKFYEHYVDLRKTEIIYASARTKQPATRPEGHEIISMGKAGNVESNKSIKTASSTY